MKVAATLALLAALVALGLTGSAQAGSRAIALPCPPAHPCGTALTVGADRVQWTSPQHFPRSAAVRVWIWANGSRLANESISRCSFYSYGSGLSVRLSICGKRAPVRIVVTSTAIHPVKLRLRYVAS